jgi:hypothetical protein
MLASTVGKWGGIFKEEGGDAGLQKKKKEEEGGGGGGDAEKGDANSGR